MLKKEKIVASLLVMFSLGLFASGTLKADEIDLASSNTVKESTLVDSKVLDGGTSLTRYHTIAYNDGVVSESKLNDYYISYLSYSKEQDVRIVNVNPGNSEVWTGGTVTGLAAKYEQSHPGYKVIGGVNGDFFMISSTCEVMNTSISEGELYKASIWGPLGTGVIGWEKDGTVHTGTPEFSSSMYLETYDDNNVKQNEYTITSVNKALSETGISLVTNDAFNGQEIDFTGYKVLELTYDIHRYNSGNNGNKDRLFLKGVITDIKTDLGKSTIKERTVYLCAKDGSLDNIELAENVKCQYHLINEWKDVVNSTGYYAQVLKDGESLFYNAGANDYSSLVHDLGYVNCKKNRTVIGVKEDGTTVLMTVEYNQLGNYGASYYECAEYLRLAGCKDGYLVDGGGSCTMAIRGDYGGFDLYAGGSDGSERGDGNAILFVVKDPGFMPIVKDTTRFSVTIDMLETLPCYRTDIKNIKLNFNGTEKSYDGTPLVFDGLEENTNYKYTVTYEGLGDDGKYHQSILHREVTTSDFNYPTAQIEKVKVTNDTCICNFSIKGLGKNQISNIELIAHSEGLDDVKQKINMEEFVKFNSNNIYITGLTKGKSYKIEAKIEIKDEVTGKIYTITTNEITAFTENTENYFVNYFYIKGYKGNEVYFEYKYTDPDNLIKHAYIDYFGITVDLTAKEGTISIPDIDLTSSAYTFDLYLETESNSTVCASITLEQGSSIPGEEIKEDKPGDIKDEEPNNQEKPKKGCKKKSLGLILSFFTTLGMLTVIFIKKH